MKTVLFPGAFDVFHYGHLSVIEDAAASFHRVVVAVGDNPDSKGKYIFDRDARIAHVADATAHIPNVEVVELRGLTMNVAREQGADALLRAIRELTDFPFEKKLAYVNGIKSGIPTLWMPARADDTLIASDMLAQLAAEGADVSEFAPRAVAVDLLDHFGHDASHVSPHDRIRPRGASIDRDDETVAVYAGSFDPLQIGHLRLIEVASASFDRVVVACGVNPAKIDPKTGKLGLFTMDERREMIEASVAHLGNVTVSSFEGLLIAHAHELGATTIIKGVRDGADFDAEGAQAFFNREYSGMMTLYVPSSSRDRFVASSMIKFLAGQELDVRPYLPGPVVLPTLRAIKPDFARRFEVSLALNPGVDPHVNVTGNRPVFIPKPQADFSQYIVKDLDDGERWAQTFAQFLEKEVVGSVTQEQKQAFLDLGHEIARGYEEPHRGHHGVSHLTETWNEVIQNCKYANISPVVPLLATAVHDVIYDPASKTNEADSAQWGAVRYRAIGIDEHIIGRVEKIVNDTAHHIFDRSDLESCAVLDADTGVLQKPWERYSRYAAGTLKEFAGPDAPFTVEQYAGPQGRIKFLQGMLEHDTLFSGLFPSYSNSRARDNMRDELALLRSFVPGSPTFFDSIDAGARLHEVLGLPDPALSPSSRAGVPSSTAVPPSSRAEAKPQPRDLS